MATLLPSLSSDEEDKNVHSDSEEEGDDEVNHDFSFGGILVSDEKGLLFSAMCLLVHRLDIVCSSLYAHSFVLCLSTREKTVGVDML